MTWGNTSPDNFVHLGTTEFQCGYQKHKWNQAVDRGDTFQKRWMSLFGVSPFICSLIWNVLAPTMNQSFGRYVHPRHLLWSLCFLKVYSTERTMRIICGGGEKRKAPDEKTYRKWVWIFVYSIHNMYETLVSFTATTVLPTLLNSLTGPLGISVSWGDRGHDEFHNRGWYGHTNSRTANSFLQQCLVVIQVECCWSSV